MAAKVYLETTIPSYLVARPSRDLVTAAHQEITHLWWEQRRLHFDLYVSEPVLREAAAGNEAMAQKRLELLASLPVLALTSEILELAESLVVEGPIPVKPPAMRSISPSRPSTAVSIC